jgi:hypothetical protein
MKKQRCVSRLLENEVSGVRDRGRAGRLAHGGEPVEQVPAGDLIKLPTFG